MKIPSKRLFRSQHPIPNIEYNYYSKISDDFKDVIINDLFRKTCGLMIKELKGKVMIEHGSDITDFLDVTTFRFGAYIIPIDEVQDFIKEIIGNMTLEEIKIIHFNANKLN